MRAVLALAALTALAACAPPLTVDQAEVLCAPQAGAAPAGAQTRVGLGVASGGQTSVGVGLSFSAPLSPPPTPAQAYEACVRQKSGQPPRRPLATLLAGQS